MQSLRSVITQATRGGRWVLSRRNFSSHCVCREANGSVERVRKRERIVSGKETNGAVERVRESLNDSWGYYAAGALLYVSCELVQRQILLQEIIEAKKCVEALRKTQKK